MEPTIHRTTELVFCKLLQSMLGVTTYGRQDHNFAAEPLSAPAAEPLSDPTGLKSCECGLIMC